MNDIKRVFSSCGQRLLVLTSLLVLFFSWLLCSLLFLLLILALCTSRSSCWLLENLQNFLISDFLVGLVFRLVRRRRRSQTDNSILCYCLIILLGLEL